MTNEERDAIAPIFHNVGRPVIVELGAYTGEEGLIFDALAGPNLRHIMVEPDPRNYCVIENNPSRPLSNRIQLVKGAIAASAGVQTFHSSYDARDGSRGSGSLLTPTGHLQYFADISFVYKQEVNCFTLDQIFTWAELPRIDLLWVDIQGAEKFMIAGGKLALSKTRYLFMEAEEMEMYAGQALKADLLKLLPDFELVQDFGFNIFLKRK